MHLYNRYSSTQPTCMIPHWRTWECSISNKVPLRRQSAESLPCTMTSEDYTDHAYGYNIFSHIPQTSCYW